MAIGGAVSALDADAWVEEESELVFGEGDHQWYTTGQEETPAPQHGGSTTLWRHPPFAEGETFIRPSSLFSFGRAHGGYDATRPDAWLGGSPANTDEQALQQMVVGTVSLHPKVGTSSAAFASASSLTVSSKPSPGVARSIARADVGEGSEVQSIQIKTAQVLRQQADGTSVASDALEGPVSAATARATTSGGAEPSWSKDIRQHPFVRLPVVNPENVQSHFTQIRVLPFDKKVDSPMEAYKVISLRYASYHLTKRWIAQWRHTWQCADCLRSLPCRLKMRIYLCAEPNY
ncbi:LOW QUALITY PROTEIN: uncharacterized protein EMH_0098980 [Eimeria mitis]|uniref:Uncharacterized protein n=1 Tax=Eimeria mitis TaxID=44415 RepID=U6JN69_9EIME|nr:LOW QUALITY PROTEIN: uncharacterized protein EMH_0098980 [Eimeria mitis]CDJ26954.1 hypothetical protein, conserved [Eimeria mitis]